MPKCPYLHLLRELLVKINIASVWRDHYNSVFNSTDGGCYTPNFSKCNDVYEDIYWFYQMK